jgi:hypothetical protein
MYNIRDTEAEIDGPRKGPPLTPQVKKMVRSNATGMTVTTGQRREREESDGRMKSFYPPAP